MSAESGQNSAGVGAVVALNKGEIIKAYALKEGDVGSPEVQVALLTKRIQNLTNHFETHREDKHSKRGMMALIGRRKALLRYLKDENPERYRALIASLGLRK
jgi:small subunit ribosomal protein S15